MENNIKQISVDLINPFMIIGKKFCKCNVEIECQTNGIYIFAQCTFCKVVISMPVETMKVEFF